MVKNTAWGYLFNFALFFSILLSSVSSEDAQDRSDRVLLTPWVKFLWEAYRNVLELLRNNNRVEKLYQETAKSGKSNLIVLYFPGTMLYLFFCVYMVDYYLRFKETIRIFFSETFFQPSTRL